MFSIEVDWVRGCGLWTGGCDRVVLYSGLFMCGCFLSCPATLEKGQLLGDQKGSLASLLVPEGIVQDGMWGGRSQGLPTQTECLRRPGLKPAFHELSVLRQGVNLRVCGIAVPCQPFTPLLINMVSVAI